MIVIVAQAVEFTPNNNRGGFQDCLCPYKYVGYGDLPAVTVQRFWTNHVETCVGVITLNS